MNTTNTDPRQPVSGREVTRSISGYFLRLAALGAALGALMGCSSPSGDDATSSSGGAPNTTENVRGDRYCEILVGDLSGTTVHIEVYNTYGLNECPQDKWDAADADAIKAEEMADSVVLNGPRYWMVDAFESSTLLDPTPKTLAGIEMRLAGVLDLTIAESQAGGAPYSPRDVKRNTTWVFKANQPVFELVDPEGRVFDMQSYSVRTKPQTQESLAGLGAELTLPAGWEFRTRVLTSDLHVTAVGGVATVVQDDFGNTYQLSQQ